MLIVPKKRWQYPLAIEREYAKDLVAYVKEETTAVESFLPEMVEAVWQNRIRQDADEESEEQNNWLTALIAALLLKLSHLSAKRVIEKTFEKVKRHTKQQFEGIMESVFGSKPKPPTDNTANLERLKTGWIEQNLALIKSVDRDIIEKTQGVLAQKIMQAADKKILLEELTREIQTITGAAEKRAALIGADQVGKLNGRMTQYRQRGAGIERYIWVTMGDRRVRPAHRPRHGVSYRWDDPPMGGHPGEAVRCRCVAQPLIDEQSFRLTPRPGSFTRAENSAIMLSEEMSYEHLKQKGQKLTSERARWWYNIRDESIPRQIDKTKSIEEQAHQAFDLRNMYRTQTRELMGDRKKAAELDRDSPNPTWEGKIREKMEGKGLTRRQAIMDILKTSTKTNIEVNEKFGVR